MSLQAPLMDCCRINRDKLSVFDFSPGCNKTEHQPSQKKHNITDITLGGGEIRAWKQGAAQLLFIISLFLLLYPPSRLAFLSNSTDNKESFLKILLYWTLIRKLQSVEIWGQNWGSKVIRSRDKRLLIARHILSCRFTVVPAGHKHVNLSWEKIKCDTTEAGSNFTAVR